jgi:hypothetical protein
MKRHNPGRLVFVSDEHGGVDAVVDATSGRLVTNIPLGATRAILSMIQVPDTSWSQCIA